ncbi:MAG TPA: isoprenylcysteine carboxylmethyltransferase family protein [Sphingomicrobium sp.]|nr:isoprenylcysteine carboxylmethyltransferase family protein [Sphingomicrobium sp.]
MRSRATALAGSLLFLLVAPGTIAGYLPWLISHWRFEQDFGLSPLLDAAGLMLIMLGLAGLLESFVRFAIKGLGTPAPIAPTKHLIVSGLYRHVRNPMYVSVVAIIIGQSLLFGQAGLLAYGALVWAGFHLFVLFYEEPVLRRRYGAEYDRFTRAVPRWLPRLRPWDGAS